MAVPIGVAILSVVMSHNLVAGWGKDAIGVADTVPIVAFVPVMMFAVLFGLSMDYEVFLISRIKEECVKSGQSRDSVVTGLAATARVITAAALIMISVFLSFVPNPDPTVKMIGLGMAAAVLVDATGDRAARNERQHRDIVRFGATRGRGPGLASDDVSHKGARLSDEISNRFPTSYGSRLGPRRQSWTMPWVFPSGSLNHATRSSPNSAIPFSFVLSRSVS
jgi:hypothetical protein